jgi:hypothetical protein
LDLERLFQTTEILKAIRRSDLWVDRFEKAKSKGILKPETDNPERKGAARVCSTREMLIDDVFAVPSSGRRRGHEECV